MKEGNLKERLKGIIPEDKRQLLNRSFEVIGDIAIIEIPEELTEFQEEIGREILSLNPSLETVLKKSGIHTGEFRTQPLETVIGANKRETIHHENNVKIKTNPETVYFSSKLSTERRELAEQTHEQEKVLVLFSGAGPYNYVFTRIQPKLGFTTGIELNHEGVRYAEESKWLNKSIAKKHPLFSTGMAYLKDKQIPFHEKQLLSNCLNLLYHFIEADAHNAGQCLKPEHVSKTPIKEPMNALFDKPAAHIEETLQHFGNTWFLDGNMSINSETFLPFFVKHAQNITLVYKEGNSCFNISDWLSKAVFLHALRTGSSFSANWNYDRVVMPLPKDALGFLGSAINCTAPGGIIHLYGFVHEEGFPDEIETPLKEYLNNEEVGFSILETRKVGQYAPRKWRVCCDIQIKTQPKNP